MCCKLILPFCILLSVENAMYSEGYRPRTQPQEMKLKDTKARMIHKGVVPHNVPPYDMKPMLSDAQQQQNLQQQQSQGVALQLQNISRIFIFRSFALSFNSIVFDHDSFEFNEI